MDILYMVLTTTILSSILTFLSTIWIKWRLENSIKHEYDKKIEDYKNDIEKRNKAEQISELLSEWLSFPDSQKELNKLSINLFLWLPDNLIIDLSNLLSHSQTNPVDIRDFIFNIRKYLNSDTKINKNSIILFTKENFIKKIKSELLKNNKTISDNDLDKIIWIWFSMNDLDKIIHSIK